MPASLPATPSTLAAGTMHPNRLLAALPPAFSERLDGALELVQLGQGAVLYEADRQLRYVYFPTTAIVSLVYLLGDGASAEIAVVGNDGMVGVEAFMGGGTMPNWAVVQSAGFAYRIGRDVFMQEFNRAGGRRRGTLQQLLLRYAQALLTQMAQISVCNRHHSVHHRLCRWLLLGIDRTPADQLTVTQEQIANMLGVRREGVTEAAGRLQSAGLIRYSRGRIALLDRAGLEAEVCECYHVIRKEYDRLLANSQRPAAMPCRVERTQLAARPGGAPYRPVTGSIAAC